MKEDLERATHFRKLAEEVRAKVASLKSPEAREIFGRLASDYDRLAESLEQVARPLKAN